MDDSKFSERLKDILLYSKEEAIRLGDKEILPEHFFLGMLRDGDFDLMHIIEGCGINTIEAKKSIERQLRRDKMLLPMEAEYIPLAKSSQRILNQVPEEAKLQLQLSFLQDQKENGCHLVHNLPCQELHKM